MKRNRKNFWIYIGMVSLFGILIYGALDMSKMFPPSSVSSSFHSESSAFEMFKSIITTNLENSFTILLFQIIVILITVRLFSQIFRFIGQPGVIGEITAGIVLGPSLLGYFFPEFFHFLFPPESLGNLNILSQIGLIFFMFIIGMELDFGTLKNKINETLVISHAGIVVPFFLGISSSFLVYQKYAAAQSEFLPFALFIGISMSITAFPVLARIVQERNMTKSSVGILSIASAANDDVTAWCLLAIVIAIVKAGTFTSALYTIALTLLFIGFILGIVRPFLKKVGNMYADSEVINKTFVGFIFLIMITSAVITEIIGIHALFGAFMAGVIMPSNIGFRKIMMEKVEDISLVFFLPFFFAYTGLHTEIGVINTPELWGICLFFIFIAILGKLGGCAIAARLVGESWKDSLIIGTLMNTRGLMQLIALNIGYEMGILSPEIFVILMLMALVTTFMTTPLLNFIKKLFAARKKQIGHAFKLLLSFGRLESGKTLLSLMHLIWGKQLNEINIIAAHYTLGTDLNPVKAKQYAQESFKFLDDAAADLHLKIDKRYKVTDRITHELIRLTGQEQIDLLLLGAGPRFMERKMIAAPEQSKYRPFFRLFSILQNNSLHLPNNLMKEKTEAMIQKINRNIAIFVNRSPASIHKLYLLIDGYEDISLLTYIHSLVKNDEITIRVCFLKRDSADPILQKNVADIITGNPNRFIMDEPLCENPLLRQPDNMLILSYKTCNTIAKDQPLYETLPSLLVIREAKKKNLRSTKNNHRLP